MSSASQPKSKFSHIFSLTYPIFLGYLSVGFIYGLLAQSSGFSLEFTSATSVFLYAGAAQFFLLNLIHGNTPYFSVFFAIFLLNLRHIFYFKPVMEKISKDPLKRLYSIFSLTDESFAVLTEENVTADDSFAVLAFDQGYWILGTFLGAVAGQFIGSRIEGLDFSLVALFTVLLVDKIRIERDWDLLLVATTLCVLAWVSLPSSLFLILVMLFCLIAVVVRDRCQQ